jgi:uncharacterized protein (TIGR03086 family)
MTSMPDLAPAARTMAALVTAVTDAQLSAPTPCPAYTLGDLIDHVGGLSLAFTAAATKEHSELTSQAPSPDAARLGDDWRTRIPQQLTALAEAWRSPDAWQGMTRAGGVDLPGEVAGIVALNELVVHGWDVAVASGQPFDGDPASLQTCLEFVSTFDAPTDGTGPFGPPVPVRDSAPLVDRLVGAAGRDPAWRGSEGR